MDLYDQANEDYYGEMKDNPDEDIVDDSLVSDMYDHDVNEFKKDITLSNNIASHIPFSGYGVLNNYLNSMSYFFFNKGLDGGSDIKQSTANENGIPYHIIGNFKGNLKTFKTYKSFGIQCKARR